MQATRTLIRGVLRGVEQAALGIRVAVRRRPWVSAAAAASVLALNVFLPPLVLSVARKPWDYFTFNPWLASLPQYLVSPDVPVGRKVAFLPNLVLFWFSADNPWGVEWGVAVSVADGLRFLAMALLFGTYLALWFESRHRIGLGGWLARRGRGGGIAATLGGIVGFSTGSCSVMGCGAPVMPVLGLAFTGLSSGMIALLSQLSGLATAAVFIAFALGVGYLGWLVGAGVPSQPAPARRPPGPSAAL